MKLTVTEGEWLLLTRRGGRRNFMVLFSDCCILVSINLHPDLTSIPCTCISTSLATSSEVRGRLPLSRCSASVLFNLSSTTTLIYNFSKVTKRFEEKYFENNTPAKVLYKFDDQPKANLRCKRRKT